jgi:MFS transporter, OFA family, oxalate/formate antiporter
MVLMDNLRRMDDLQRAISVPRTKTAIDAIAFERSKDQLRLFGMPAHQGRWVFIPLGIVALLCLGTVYSWSIFRKPVELAMNAQAAAVSAVSATDTLPPFAALLFTFSILMPLTGRFIERFGASRVSAVGGAFVGLGYFLSGSATTIAELILTYVSSPAPVSASCTVCPLRLLPSGFPITKGEPSV